MIPGRGTKILHVAWRGKKKHKTCSGLLALFAGLSFHLTGYMLDPDLGAKEMMLDKSWLLPELICSLLGAVRPRGGRKGLETV